MAALAAWERGDLDIISVPSTEVRRVLDTPEFAEHDQPRYHAVDRVLRLRKLPGCRHLPAERGGCGDAALPGLGPTQNKNFRRALTQAIDRAELIQVGFAGLGALSYSPTMPGIPGFPTITDADNPYPFDVAAAAAALMATALDELGIRPAGSGNGDADRLRRN